MDSKLVQGMLLGTCLCLLLATAISVAHYGVYREYVDQESGTRIARGVTEGRTVAGDVGLLKFAPPGTVGYLALDVQAVLASPVGQKLLEDAEAENPEGAEDLRELGQVVLFLGAPTPDQPVAVYGLLKMAAGKTTAGIAEELAQAGTKTTVEGLDAYIMEQPAAVLAVVDDSTVLGGSTESELTKMIQVYQGGASASNVSEIQQMGAAFAGDMLNGCLLITDEMKALPPGEEMPAWSLGAKGAGLGLSLGAGLELKGMLRLGSGDDASQAASDAQTGIAEFKTGMQQMVQGAAEMGVDVQAFSLIDKVKVSADGADVNLTIELTEDDMRKLPDLAMSMFGMLMMGDMMEAPGMEAPPGFGTP